MTNQIKPIIIGKTIPGVKFELFAVSLAANSQPPDTKFIFESVNIAKLWLACMMGTDEAEVIHI